MEYIKKTAEGITKHAVKVIDGLEKEKVARMIDIISNAKSIFIVGTGRSELVGKAFAMRLMHLGFKVHVIGEVTTPAIWKEDCLVAISGSGETKAVTIAAETAKDVGASVIGITASPDSTLGGYLDALVKIDSRTKMIAWEHYDSHVLKGTYDDLTPLGTLFEDTTLLFLDGVIAEFMALLNIKEVDLKKRHAIIEK
ncbi:MAG: 6-phospho-3-hexuloisomerase [Euryarchaeota archaeon]|nr:6-phospho-3-hexuloisomerase [Euryarchaeota archaeon]